MTQEEATSIARSHLDEEPFPDPEYRWVLKVPHDLGDAWYFDYSFEHVGDLPEAEWEGFAGAPGFLVPKAGGAARPVSWSEYTKRSLDRRAV